VCGVDNYSSSGLRTLGPSGTHVVVPAADPSDFGAPARHDFAVAIRPGEHACCRFAHADDRRRLAVSFVRAGLDRGHKVIYLSDVGDEETRFVADLAAVDDRVDGALERGQLEVRPAPGAYIPDGTFDPARVRDTLREEHARALADGYPTLTMAGDMSWAVGQVHGLDQLGTYEHEVTTTMEGDLTRSFLCIYDHGRFGAGALAEVAESHRVDVSPELAPVARVGYLAASRVLPGPVLRLCGELDFGCAEAVAGVLDAHYHGTLRLDLADLAYVDVAGLRTLRGKSGQPLAITAASRPVRSLLALLGWDTDPGIEIAEAAA
jgi:ABC-type transporter Mla MlaB component